MKLKFEKEFVVEECCTCSALFAVTCMFQRECKQTKKDFYCPNGHPQSYTKSTADILSEQLDGAKLNIRILETEVQKLRTKKRKTK